MLTRGCHRALRMNRLECRIFRTPRFATMHCQVIEDSDAKCLTIGKIKDGDEAKAEATMLALGRLDSDKKAEVR